MTLAGATVSDGIKSHPNTFIIYLWFFISQQSSQRFAVSDSQRVKPRSWGLNPCPSPCLPHGATSVSFLQPTEGLGIAGLRLGCQLSSLNHKWASVCGRWRMPAVGSCMEREVSVLWVTCECEDACAHRQELYYCSF